MNLLNNYDYLYDEIENVEFFIMEVEHPKLIIKNKDKSEPLLLTFNNYMGMLKILKIFKKLEIEVQK